MPADPTIFRKVEPGQRPSASEHNKLTETVTDLTTFARRESSDSRVMLARLDEVVGKFGRPCEEDESGYVSDFSFDRSATLQFLDDATGLFKDTTKPNQKTTVTDPFELIYDQNEKVLLLFSRQSGKHYPVNPRTVRHVITVRDQHNNYPLRSQAPDTYPFRFVKLTFAEDGGANGHTMTYLNPTGTAEDGFIHNIMDPDLYDAFIPVGTLLEAYNVTEQWFTMFLGAIEDSSESRSYSSISCSSPSASSDEFSESSISSSVSGSSASSSVSSSLSSAASSDSSSFSRSESSGGSSISESSSGYLCVTVVTSLSFDDVSCVLTYCTREICFPKSLGVTVGDEVC